MDVPKEILKISVLYVKLKVFIEDAGYRVCDYQFDKQGNVSLVKIQKLSTSPNYKSHAAEWKWIKL